MQPGTPEADALGREGSEHGSDESLDPKDADEVDTWLAGDGDGQHSLIGGQQDATGAGAAEETEEEGAAEAVGAAETGLEAGAVEAGAATTPEAVTAGSDGAHAAESDAESDGGNENVGLACHVSDGEIVVTCPEKVFTFAEPQAANVELPQAEAAAGAFASAEAAAAAAAAASQKTAQAAMAAEGALERAANETAREGAREAKVNVAKAKGLAEAHAKEEVGLCKQGGFGESIEGVASSKRV
eukprot:7391813-Prymnesium_polylepis.1